MPLVFVHGVSNRSGAEYDRSLKVRDGYFRSIALIGQVDDPQAVHIENPYWGGDGVSFAWSHACLPEDEARYESFGPGSGPVEDVLVEMAPEDALAAGATLPAMARQSLDRAIDCLWAAAAFSKPDDKTAAGLVALATRALRYAQDQPNPTWLAKVRNDDQFVSALLNALETWKDPAGIPPAGDEAEAQTESFGAREVWDFLKTTATRISASAAGAGRRLAGRVGELKDRVVDAIDSAADRAKQAAVAEAKAAGLAALGPIADLAVKYGRSWVEERAGLFVGDVFVYLDQRGRLDEQAPILQKVIAAFEAADAARTASDPKLIIVGHSMGGNIAYDILTHYRPKLKCDLFLTVGSQVGFFEEMKLFRASDRAIPSDLEPFVKKRDNITRWLNVFDPLDIFGYATSRIFADSHDFKFDTQTNALGAHGMYFHRPHFHERLRERIGGKP